LLTIRRVQTGGDAVRIAVDPAVQFGLLYRYRLPGRPSSHSQAGAQRLAFGSFPLATAIQATSGKS
jgi:hypothetical protein